MLTKIKEFFSDKEFFRTVLLIATPIIIQQLITTSVTLVDNLMVGTLGEDALSAVATINQITFILNLAGFGLLGGAGIYVSQFFGAGDVDSLKKTFSYKLLTSIILYVFGIIVILTLQEPIVALFLDKGTLSYNLALEYLKYLWPSYILMALALVFATTLREVFKPKYPMIAGILAILVNTCLNAILIFGLLGNPPLGVKGAAIATTVSRVVELGVVIYFYLKHAKVYLPNLKDLFKFDKSISRRVTTKALPLLINETIWSLSKTIIFYAYATRGLSAVAGINITTTVANMAFVFIMGVSSAIQILVGAKLGENKLDEAKKIAHKLMILEFLTAIGIGLVLILTKNFWVSLYDVSEQTKIIATTTLTIYAIFTPVFAINNGGYFILRSGGAMKETMIVDIMGSVVFTVPLSLILAHFTDMNVIMLYLLTNAVELFKVFITFRYYNKGIWLKNLANG